MTDKGGRTIRWYNIWPQDLNNIDFMDLPGNNQNVRAQNLKQITLEKQTTRYMFLLNNIYQSFIPL